MCIGSSDAIVYYIQAVVASRDAGHRSAEGQTLYHLGESQREADQLDAAYESLHEALVIFEKLGDPRADEVWSRLKSFD